MQKTVCFLQCFILYQKPLQRLTMEIKSVAVGVRILGPNAHWKALIGTQRHLENISIVLHTTVQCKSTALYCTRLYSVHLLHTTVQCASIAHDCIVYVYCTLLYSVCLLHTTVYCISIALTVQCTSIAHDCIVYVYCILLNSVVY